VNFISESTGISESTTPVLYLKAQGPPIRLVTDESPNLTLKVEFYMFQGGFDETLHISAAANA